MAPASLRHLRRCRGALLRGRSSSSSGVAGSLFCLTPVPAICPGPLRRHGFRSSARLLALLLVFFFAGRHSSLPVLSLLRGCFSIRRLCAVRRGISASRSGLHIRHGSHRRVMRGERSSFCRPFVVLRTGLRHPGIVAPRFRPSLAACRPEHATVEKAEGERACPPH